MTLRVSVVIPAYNHGCFVGEAIDSVLGQTFPPAETIVVDDGSTDDTEGRLGHFAGRIKVIRQQNAGVSAARNAGAALAVGEVLAFLDADDAWLPDKLARQLAVLEADERIGLVHCSVTEVDAGGRSLRERRDGQAGSVAEAMLCFEGGGAILGGGSAAIVRRRLFEQVGGFDTRMSTSADWDFHFRVARLCRVGFVPEPLLRYRVHGDNMHRNVTAMEHDMLLAYAKAFAVSDPSLAGLRRRAYASLHSMLAGSYWHAGHRGKAILHGAHSLTFGLSRALYLLAFPLRQLARAGRRLVGRC